MAKEEVNTSEAGTSEVKTKLLKAWGIFKKIASILVILWICNAIIKVANIRTPEIETFYIHTLATILWILTAGGAMWLYNIWTLSKSIIEGEDEEKNQEERLSVLKVHSAIIIASAIVVFGTTFIYFVKVSP